MRCLVTGGAGFIGKHLCNKLRSEGHDVSVLDNFDRQIHKPNPTTIELDIRDYHVIKDIITIWKPQWIFHLAAKVGVGQSQYQIKEYVDTNISGTANLLNVLANEKHKVQKLMVASSMSVYGDLPLAREKDICKPASIYAITKKAQEDMVMNFGKTYNFPVVVLRFFNTYGTGQTLDNPYTGTIAIFINRLLNNKSPIVYEDGQQTRDLISVHDIVDATISAMKSDKTNGQIFNVGTGIPNTILNLATRLIKILCIDIIPNITNKYRKGDIRHCYADITKINKVLGWLPKVSLQDGLKEVVEWAKKQRIEDNFDIAQKELEKRKLM